MDSDIPFQLHHGFLIVVEGEIGSLRGLRFILDTGTTRSIVDKKVARSLGIEGSKDRALNINRNVEVQSATFPELRFGPVSAINPTLLIANLASFSEFADGVDALIGLDLLWGHKILIDQQSKKVSFSPWDRRVKPLQASYPLYVLVRVDVQGKSLLLTLDTGMKGILLYEERLHKRVPNLRTKGDTNLVAWGDRMFAKKVELEHIRVGNKEIPHPEALLVRGSANLPPEIDGVLGVDCLHARRMYFDFNKNILSWE